MNQNITNQAVEMIEGVESFELFAEELPEQTDFAYPSTLACLSTGACSCVFSTAGTLTTKACPD